MAISKENNIFPNLAPRAELFEKVCLIEKTWLDQTPLSFPEHLPSLVKGLSFFKINGVEAAMESHNRLRAKIFPSSMLAAIYNQAIPLVYMIGCRDGKISLFLGTHAAGASSMAALIETVVSPSHYQNNTRIIQEETGNHLLEKHLYCAALTGIPSYQDNKIRSSLHAFPEEHGIDNLILGMLKEEWFYIVQAFPIKREQTNFWFEACSREIKDTKEAFLPIEKKFR